MTKYVNNNGVSEMWTNTKNYISAQLLGKSDVGHTHSASDITSGLATVATSGSYNDLSNKPTIPTVNNATLTIQKNGTNVQTFTANQSTNATANITVPTKTSDLTNDSGFITSDNTKIPLAGTNALAGSIVPDTDNAYNLGDSTYGFANIYTRYVQGSNTQKELSLFSSNNKNDPWNHGACIGLYTNDYPGDSDRIGTFSIRAQGSGNNTYNLIGTPSGALTWGTKNVAMQEDVIPRSGGAVLNGQTYSRTVDNGILAINGSSTDENGAFLRLHGKDYGDTPYAGSVFIRANNGSNACNMLLRPDGTLTWGNKNVAMQEDTVPRSGGAVLSGDLFTRTVDNGYLAFKGGTATNTGASIWLYGKDESSEKGTFWIGASNKTSTCWLEGFPGGSLTWRGQPIQYGSDARLKQQISEIDDKLLDAWEDVEPVQFKYNDAVNEKGKDKARLHTGYVVQQIDKACKSHGVDISEYGLYCHEEYPEETEEVEVEQADGTKTKETKVIREASEHYSLRYTEALIVECAYLRKCIKELRTEIEQLKSSK